MKNRTETTQGLAPQQLLEMLAGLAPHHSGLGDMVAAHVTAHGPLMASPDAGPVPAGPVPAASVAGSASTAPGGSPSSCLSELHLFLSCLLRYDLALAGHGACDYDDLLGLAVALLQQPAARRAAAANFRCVHKGVWDNAMSVKPVFLVPGDLREPTLLVCHHTPAVTSWWMSSRCAGEGG